MLQMQNISRHAGRLFVRCSLLHGTRAQFCTSLQFTRECRFADIPGTIPTYRVMPLDNAGSSSIEGGGSIGLGRGSDRVWCRDIYTQMVRVGKMDQILYEAQRQGRIPFYMTCTGEEAALLGSASALKPDDVIFAQYREVAVLLYRGFTFDMVMNQCFANSLDPGKGRQMPVHYGSPELHYHTISSPLATQLPHAVGAAYALKRARTGRIAVCYFGEGAASEGDFHAALNLAATTSSPVLFFCRNNGYAISTPVSEQYRGDGIGGRGAGYGIKTIRVDGNDVLAVHQATSYARAHVQECSEPVLIEAMTYRVGHHSTSDDSTQYRSREELEAWQVTNNPSNRLRAHMQRHGWWDPEEDAELTAEARKDVLTALEKAEKQPRSPLCELFTDVYAEQPVHLNEQQAELEVLVKNHADLFPVLK